MPSDPYLDDLRRREKRLADIEMKRVVGPVGSRGLWKVEGSGGAAPTLARGAPGAAYKPGALVPVGSPLGGPGDSILRDAPPGKQGAAEHPFLPSDVGEADAVGMVVSLDPAVFTPGSTDNAVRANGLGFSPATELAFLVFDQVLGRWVLDPWVTLRDFTFVDSRTIDFVLDVDSDAPTPYWLTIAVVPPGSQIPGAVVLPYFPTPRVAQIIAAGVGALPGYLAVHWPLGGPMRIWEMGSDPRVEYGPINPPTGVSGLDPGERLAPQMVVQAAGYPDALYLAWVDNAGGFGGDGNLRIYDLVGNALRTVTPQATSLIRDCFAAEDGRVYFFEADDDHSYLYSVEPGDVASVQLVHQVTNGEAQAGNFSARGNYYGLARTADAAGGYWVLPYNGDAPSFVTGPYTAGTYGSFPVPGAEPTATGLGYSASAWPVRQVRVVWQSTVDDALNSYSAAGGLADDGLVWPWAAKPAGSGAVLAFPFQGNRTQGRWFDVTKASTEPENADPAIGLVPTELYDPGDPTSYPHVVIPLSAQASWE